MQTLLKNGKNQNCFDPVAVSHIIRAYKHVLSEALPHNECSYKRASGRKIGFLVLITCQLVYIVLENKFETSSVGGKSNLDDNAAIDCKSGVDCCHKNMNCMITTLISSVRMFETTT
jgi:hypothetical protein